MLFPVTANAAEITSDMQEVPVSDYEDLLTAGVGGLFSNNLTSEEYKQIAKDAEGARWGYTNLGICNVEENNLNIRQEPGEDGKLVGKLPKNAACEIISSENGWAYITSGKVEGYVKEEYLLSGFGAEQKGKELARTVAVSSADALNIREEPSTDAEVVTRVAQGEELEIAEVLDNGWIKVYLDDEEVYVSADYIDVKSDLPTAITMTELLYGQGVSDVRVDLCQYAKQFLGNPYVWGGTSLTGGADCSGFVLSVFKKYGVSLPHSSRAQANSGKSINASELQPGDLVFYAKGGTINHVAIYIGSGQVIHASSPKTGIKISSYNYRTPAKMVRILQD
ncbi:MAG: SH3 domain-containing protein [Lachnospiraceae bacterium]|nr:SH3 domain-containing protein [Lachnospiraceae bacterium]